MPEPRDVFVEAISTAVPSHAYSQEFALDVMTRETADTDARRNFLQRVYQGSAIGKRHTAVRDFDAPLSERELFGREGDLRKEPGTAARNVVFGRVSRELSLQAAGPLFTSFRDAAEITHLVTVSCTGFQAPGFDWHLMRELKLSDSIKRYHLGFMGCYAAFPSLRLARDICLGDPLARVLVVHCELSSVHLKFHWQKDTQVANALFADGAAAAVVSAREEGAAIRLDTFVSKALPDSEEEMTWDIGDRGFDMTLSSRVPALLEGALPDAVRTLSEGEGFVHHAIHPGGKAVLEAVSRALELPQGQLEASYRVLRDFGNMSSATLFFVLKEMIRMEKKGPTLAAAFGPGLTLEAARMELL